MDDAILTPGMSVFDYGCGRGGDLNRLQALDFSCDGWDPTFRPENPLRSAALVNLGYVINVIESADERAYVLRRAWSLTEQVLVVSAPPA